MTTAMTTGSNFSLRAVFERHFAGFAERRALQDRYARTVHELNALADRELEDLGFARGDIHDVARESVYGA